MINQINKLILRIFIISVVFLAGISCDSILPEEFDDEKTYTTSQTDIQACTTLSAAATDSIGQILAPYQSVQIRAMSDLVDTSAFSGSTENQIILAKFNEISDSLMAITMDAPLFVSYSASLDDVERTAFSKITSSQSRDVYFYVSLVYTSINIDEFIGIQLIKPDTSVVSLSESLLGETVSECSQVVNSRTIPTIRARYKMHLEQGTEYLVRFFVNNPTTIGSFKLLIMSI